MSDHRTKFVLRCPACNAEHKIDQGQAGLTIPCLCGNRLDVPTIRHLSKLRQIEVASDSEDQADEGWSLRRGVTMLGLLIAAGGVIAGLALLLRPVSIPTADSFAEADQNIPPQFAFSEWWELKHLGPKLGRGKSKLTVDMERITHETREQLSNHRRWTWAAWSVAGIGLVVAGGAQLVLSRPAKPSQKRSPARVA